MAKINRYKTSDIRLHKDSQGYYEAKHMFQGVLYESEYFENRNEARQEAVNVLNELKDGMVNELN